MGDADRKQHGPSDYLRHTAEHEITCQEFVELVTDYFEGALPARTNAQAEEHLVMCDWCTTYAEQMQSTIVALSDLGSEESAAESSPDESSISEPSSAVLTALRARRGGSP